MLQSKKLSRFADLKHGFTTKESGSLNIRRDPKAKDRLADIIGISQENITGFEQVHGRSLAIVMSKDKGRIIPAVDGGITAVTDCFLTVNVADCVPVLFFDPANDMVGAVHAGWRGISAGILSEALDIFARLGSKAQNIIAAVGPHINGCCYVVSADRAKLFMKIVGDINIIYKVGNKWHLDLTAAVVKSLLREGLTRDHLDYSLSCTSCQKDLFYSFRRDKSVIGEMAAFIGIMRKEE